MKKFSFLLFLAFLPSIYAEQIRNVTVQNTHMSADTLQRRFHLKPGDLFTEDSYDKAKEDLQKLRIFRTLEFVEKKHKDGIDIHIKADDRSYVIPMLFGVTGNKHALGLSLIGKNLFKQAEQTHLFVGAGRDGFELRGSLRLDRQVFSAGYDRLRFKQRFYEDGWVSSPGMFNPADDSGKYKEVFLAQTHGRQEDAYVSYRYYLSSLWSVALTPQYQYYTYQDIYLDTGNHSHLSVQLQYAEDVHPGMNMSAQTELAHLDKQDILRDLPHMRSGKWAAVSYTAGGSWSGSDYTINKAGLAGSYLWELKQHHRIALFAKAQRAFDAPFSNQVQSSDLLFGMGIYDREQRGKGGVSAGVSFTYFAWRSKNNVLNITPFYEQAYIRTQEHSYQSHSGVGASLGYRYWPIPWPVYLTFTHNLDDSSHHLGCKVGGHF